LGPEVRVSLLDACLCPDLSAGHHSEHQAGACSPVTDSPGAVAIK
jgi:hypothetical protein